MKATLKKEDLAYYISEADIIRFIHENAPMEWNKCCDYVRECNITGEEGSAFWMKENVFGKNNVDYNPEAIKWMKLFFEAHPFINKVMIVFDD